MTRARRRFPDGISTLATLIAAIVIWGLLLSATSEHLGQVAITSLINLILVVGLYIFAGNSGVISFGHLSFMAIGAYTASILTIPALNKAILLPDLPGFLKSVHLGTLPAIGAAVVVTSIFALTTGISLMRLSGVAASIATFGVLIIVSVFLTNYSALSGTGGTLTGIPNTTGLGSVIAWSVIALGVAYAFQSSRTGARLRASREDQFAAKSVGIGIFRERLIAWTVSAALIAVAGALEAHYLGALSPTEFWLPQTFLALAMLVVGGMGSLTGAAVGTFTVTALVEGLNHLESGINLAGVTIGGRPGLANVVLAIVMIVILVMRPTGLTRGRELRLEPGRLLRRGPRAVPESGAHLTRHDERDGGTLDMSDREALAPAGLPARLSGDEGSS
jgi:branched-chain amino acid transport system permease protein